MTDYCLLVPGQADATLPPVKLPPVTLDARAPKKTDDSSAPYPAGAMWQLQGEISGNCRTTPPGRRCGRGSIIGPCRST
jgi:hypothetical protein